MTSAHYSKSVLLVDDNPADLQLFARVLRRNGFKVVATGEISEAMSAIVSGQVGCFVTDEIMAVTGRELAEMALGVRNDMGVIFLSGSPRPHITLPRGAVFVTKDSPERLVSAVQECMEKWLN